MFALCGLFFAQRQTGVIACFRLIVTNCYRIALLRCNDDEAPTSNLFAVHDANPAALDEMMLDLRHTARNSRASLASSAPDELPAAAPARRTQRPTETWPACISCAFARRAGCGGRALRQRPCRAFQRDRRTG